MADKTFGSSAGLTILAEDQATPANGMVAHVTSSWNSGYQNGDIKGAFLSDTDDTDLVGGEYVVDGGFDDPTKWTLDSGATISSGVLNVPDTALSDSVAVNTGGVLFPHGSAAVVTFTISNSTANFGVRVGFYRATGERLSFMAGGAYFTADGTYRISVPPYEEDEDWYVGFYRVGVHTGTLEIDNVSVKLADADRSVNNNGLIVNGTVTRTFVDEV